MIEQKEFLSVNKVAEVVGYPRQRIYSDIRAGRLRIHRLPPSKPGSKRGRIRCRVADVQKYRELWLTPQPEEVEHAQLCG